MMYEGGDAVYMFIVNNGRIYGLCSLFLHTLLLQKLVVGLGLHMEYVKKEELLRITSALSFKY